VSDKADLELEVPQEKVDEKRGGRNLMVLGLVAVGLAIVTSVASLSIYYATGDIYLDRSRPGFISDEEVEENKQKQENNEKTYVFAPDGMMDKEVLDEYLEEFDKVRNEAKSAAEAFSADALSDDNLGISE
jgi:hypothetical protein